MPAGAYTKRENAAPVWQMAGELVAAGGQGGVPRVLLILRGVHAALQMLNAHAHGKGLGLHVQPLGIQPLNRVPCAVAQGQNELSDGESVAALRSGHGDSLQGAVFRVNSLQPVAEADVRSHGEKFFAQIFQCGVQHVGAHVGLGVGEDALRCAAGDQLLQDPAVAQIPGAGVQLPVGKSAGAALTELHIGLRQQLAALPEALHVPLPLLHGLPPLQQNGAQTGVCQKKGGK